VQGAGPCPVCGKRERNRKVEHILDHFEGEVIYAAVIDPDARLTWENLRIVEQSLHPVSKSPDPLL
jgi:hypothetical protein